MKLKIAIIGTGIIGACCAVHLARENYDVIMIEPGEPGDKHAASYGNAGWISPGSVVPMSMPGLWKKIPAYIADPYGPLTIRWRYLPSLLPWLVAFLVAGSTQSRVERTAGALKALLGDAIARHIALAAEAGVSELISKNGLLYVYPNRAAFDADGNAWRLRRKNGVCWRELDGDALRREHPGLGKQYNFAALVEAGGHCPDPGRYTAVLVKHAHTSGAKMTHATATGFKIESGRLVSVLTDKGEIVCDKAVICAGIGSRSLVRKIGENIPLVSERGYHVAIACKTDYPNRPIMPSDGRMGITLTSDGLRAAGQVELANEHAPPDWRRADILLDALKAAFPDMEVSPSTTVTKWMGHRPSTPDGLPVIGPSVKCADIIHAFGHGHVGFASGPATASIVADLVAERPPLIALAPYAPDRFGRWL
jgi:D-amino-acid dehydrogenase